MISLFLFDSLSGIDGLVHCGTDADGMGLSGLEMLVWHLADTDRPRSGPVFRRSDPDRGGVDGRPFN